VRDEHPDVLVLQEVTRPWWAHLESLRAEYPYYNALPRQGGSGIVLFSRLPIDEVEILSFGGSPWPGMFARVRVGGRPVSVLALHPPTPMRPDKFRARNAQFAAAAARLGGTRGPKVVVGDHKTTPWSPYYADLVRDARLSDPRLGAGLWTTWPMPMPAFLRIPIDHCLTSEDVRVEAIRTGGRTGSDHRPLVVDLAVPAP
jgi:endonuclease/exonuclease/phosphatase (EEP) superfamily protein YafD